MQRCTCGYTVFHERRTAVTQSVACWVRYSFSSDASGLGASPLGAGELGAGAATEETLVWARHFVDQTSTTRDVVCSSCQRVRTSRTIARIGIVASFLEDDRVVLLAAGTDASCYTLEFRGTDGSVLESMPYRTPGDPDVYTGGSPEEFTETPLPTDLKADAQFEALFPNVDDPMAYSVVLVDRCAGTELVIGDVFLEGDPMLIPIQIAELDAPLEWLNSPRALSDHTSTSWLRGPAISSIPFDKCSQVLIYDARLGSLPSSQGWTETSPGAGQFSMVNGALKQTRDSGAQARYYKAITGISSAPTMIHGYAVGRAATDAGMRATYIGVAGAASGSLTGFRSSVHLDNPQQLAVHGNLDDGLSDPNPAVEVLPGWAYLAYDHVRSPAETRMWTPGGAVEITGQDTFSLSSVGTTTHRVEAHFGAFGSETGTVWTRVFCVSAPGRFVRPGFRVHSMATSPVLRLYLFAPDVISLTTARFLVRYGSGMLDPRARPLTAVSQTATLSDGGTVYELAITLTDAGVGPLWFTVEREWDHVEDACPSVVHLLQLSLRPV